jgi:hypothetical protein
VEDLRFRLMVQAGDTQIITPGFSLRFSTHEIIEYYACV